MSRLTPNASSASEMLLTEEDLNLETASSSSSASSHQHPASAAAFTEELDFASIYHFERIVYAVVPAIFGLIAVLGLVGNLVVVFVVVSNRQMHSTTNVLIVSLAFADLLFIVICVPFTAIGYSVNTWPFGDVWCKIYQYVAQVTAYVSVYTLVLMSLDRYLAVVHPIRSIGIRTYLNASIVSALTWLLILATNSPIIFEFETIEYTFVDGQTRSACMNVYIFNNDSGAVDAGSFYHGRLYYGCFFAFAYLVPLLLVSLLYGLMIRRLMHGVLPGAGCSSSSTAADGASVRTFSAAKAAERSRGKRRVTRLVLVVVVVFAVCWLPLQLVLVVQFVVQYPDEETEHTGLVVMKIAFSCLAYMNSCVNPILYAFLSDNFRKSVRRTTGDWCASIRRRGAGGGSGAGAGCCSWWAGCPTVCPGANAAAGYTGGRTGGQRDGRTGRLECGGGGGCGGGNGRTPDVNTRSTAIALTDFEVDGQPRGQ